MKIRRCYRKYDVWQVNNVVILPFGHDIGNDVYISLKNIEHPKMRIQ